MNTTKPNHAFTLIELLIVVAIIGILAVIAIPNFLNAQIRANVAVVESNFRTFTTANELYRTDHGTYLPFLNISTSWIANVSNGFLHLTTPIAYLSYETIADPFASRFESGLLDSNLEFDQKVDYAISLGTRAYRGKEIYQTKSGDYYAKKVNSFILESVGPDTIDSIFDSSCFGSGCKYTLFSEYDPSNGLYSNGDIIKVVGSVIPEMRIYF